MHKDDPTAWHGLAVTDVLARLDASGTGLTAGQAAERLARIGTNEVAEAPKEPFVGELVKSLAEPLQLLLIGVAVLSAVFGEVRDAVAIGAIIAAVAVIEALTEVRAERAIAALRQLAAPIGRVVRDGVVRELAVQEIVPGDVIVIEAGDIVPADARVLQAAGLRVDESPMTGEPEPAAKSATAVAEDADLADRSSAVFAGTEVVAGEGRAVVVATGPRTELGQLGKLVADQREPTTPLQRSMGELARSVLVVAVGTSVIVPAVGVAAGRPLREMLLAGLTLAFATVPEELPILVTVLLAVGGRQLARRGALLRHLRAAETLGAINVVLTDKTGTLTENRLRLTELVGEEMAVLTTALLTQQPGGDRLGREPLEAALRRAADDISVGISASPDTGFPFDPDRKLVTRVWRTPTGYEVAVAGAPEAVLPRCRPGSGGPEVAGALRRLTRQGSRVVAFARRQADQRPADRDAAEAGLEFVGLAAFEDPLRPGVADAVRELHRAGVATIVITGDHPDTAAAIAHQAGLTVGIVLRGSDLARYSDADLSDAVGHGTVIARATPADKLRVVRLLQGRGDGVAVTGDGVNDAPALAAADVGIAMGLRGTDLARAAADVVLTDDAYPTVAAAVEQGRNVASQLRRAVAFYLGAKVALVTAMVVPLALGLPAPFAPVHIVLLELFMDLGASLAFVGEPFAPGAMRRPPRPLSARFLDRAEMAAIGTVGVAMAAAVLPIYLVGGSPLAAQRAAAVGVWLTANALVAWALRARPALSPAANVAFPLWVGATVAAGALVAFTPFGDVVGLSVPEGPALALTPIAVAAAIALTAAARRAFRLGVEL